MIRRTEFRSGTGGTIVRIGIGLSVAIMLSACAGVDPGRLDVGASPSIAESNAFRRYATMDGAAFDALVRARKMTRSFETGRIQVGSIVRSQDEFDWLPPIMSASESRSVVRFAIVENHVATYIIHPRTGIFSVDRENEQITAREMKLVDQVDPLHRPIYVLTPRGRLLTYRHGESVVEIADLRELRRRERRDNNDDSNFAGKQLEVDLRMGPN